MSHDQRVIVDIEHPRIRVNELGNLVRIVRRGQPSPDVDELPHSVAPRQVPHRPPEELPVSHSPIDDLGAPLDHLGGDGPVGLKVIFPVQPDVVDPRRLWHQRIESWSFSTPNSGHGAPGYPYAPRCANRRTGY